MPLTEEEKNLIAIFRGSEYHQDKVVVDLVDRLMAENEELKKSRNVWANRHLNPKVEQLQVQLDAVKKAWGATMDKASDDVFEALDKLIGGGE